MIDMDKIEEGSWLVGQSYDHTLRNFGGNEGEAKSIIEKVVCVRRFSGAREVLEVEPDPFDYTWHPNDFRFATQREIREGKGARYVPEKGIPLWVNNVKNSRIYPIANRGAHIVYLGFNPDNLDDDFPPYEDLLKSPGVWKNTNNACFAALDGYFLREAAGVIHNTRSMWFCVNLSYDYTDLNPDILKRWFNTLVFNGCLPEETRHTASKKRFTVYYPIKDYSLRRVFQIMCFIRDAHEHPSIVPTTLNLIKNHSMNFFVAYTLAFTLPKGKGSNHSQFDGDETGSYGRACSTPQKVAKRAAQIEGYVFDEQEGEKPLWMIMGDDAKRNMYSFKLNSYVRNLKVAHPKVKEWNDLKGLMLNHT